MKANIPTAISRKISGSNLLKVISGSAHGQWGGDAYTRAERGGGGGFGTDERPHMFDFSCIYASAIDMQNFMTIGRVES